MVYLVMFIDTYRDKYYVLCICMFMYSVCIGICLCVCVSRCYVCVYGHVYHVYFS